MQSTQKFENREENVRKSVFSMVTKRADPSNSRKTLKKQDMDEMLQGAYGREGADCSLQLPQV